jgi:esterase/lipase superfamily enzyme
LPQLLPLSFEFLAIAIMAALGTGSIGESRLRGLVLQSLRSTPMSEYVESLSSDELNAMIWQTLIELMHQHLVIAREVASADLEDHTFFRATGTLTDEQLVKAYIRYGESSEPSVGDSLDLAPKTHKPAEYGIARVFFATDRAGGSLSDFEPNREPNELISFGACDVSIPYKHQLGRLERPPWLLELVWDGSPKYHIKLLRTTMSDEAKFLQDIRASSGPKPGALIFVPGYLTTFAAAVRRAAQLANDLAFSGAAIAYSWPSEGRVASYARDENNAEWTVPHFQCLLASLRRVGIETVHIIAHSMGARVAVNAVAGMPAHLRPCARTFILAAPDIDRAIFIRLVDAMKASAEQITLYASSRDQALRVSKGIHGYERAGDAANLLVIDGIISIDASNVDTDLFGHGYFSNARSVVTDIYDAIRGNGPPRAQLRPLGAPPAQYWEIAK